MSLAIVEQGEKLWLYQVEEAVIMVEVKPPAIAQANPTTYSIGQVVLKRLIDAEQAIERLSTAVAIESATQETSITHR